MLETQYGSFTKTLYLPDNVNPDMIKAQMNDGVLHVAVPKDEHKTMKRQISIFSNWKQDQRSEAAGNQVEAPAEEDTAKKK